MGGRWHRVLCLLLLLLLLAVGLAGGAGPASAQPQGGSGKDPVAEAHALYLEGQQLFNVAEYDKAIDKFKAAYFISNEPLLIFNIAQAYRLKGDCAQALVSYRTYLREAPNPKNRDKVDLAVKECEEKLAQRPAGPTTEPTGARAKEPASGPPPAPAAEPPPAGPNAGPTGPAATPPPVAPARRPLRTSAVRPDLAARDQPATLEGDALAGRRGPSGWTWVALGAGSAGLAAGVVFHVLAYQQQGKLADAATGAEWDRYDPTYRRDRILAYTGYAVAAVGLGAGLYLWVHGRHRDQLVEVGGAGDGGAALLRVSWTR